MKPIELRHLMFGAFIAGLVAATVACLCTLWPWGMWVGRRDAQILQVNERLQQLARCEGRVPVVIISLRGPQHDTMHCADGSLRMASKP